MEARIRELIIDGQWLEDEVEVRSEAAEESVSDLWCM